MHFSVITTIAAAVIFVAATPFQFDEPSHGIAIPLTKYSPQPSSNTSVGLDVLDSHVASFRVKILRNLDNYERNTGTLHPSAANRNLSRKREDIGSVKLASHRMLLWLGSITVGTPPRPFTVEFDTGSADLFLPSSACGEHCQGRTNLWDTGSSETAYDLDRTFSLRFADGGVVAGEQYTDNVTVASFTADVQVIGLATEYSHDYHISVFPADGVLGMAFQSISGFPASPVLTTLVTERKLSNPVFSFKLSSAGGELYIGGSNSSLYSGRIAYSNVIHQGHWEVNMDKVQVNSKTALKNIKVVIDTGSDYIFGDSARVLTLHKTRGGKAMPGTPYFTFPCLFFPSVTMTFGGKSFKIPAEVLNQGPVENGSPDCFSGFLSHALDDLESWTIGNIFLQQVYTVFDLSGHIPRVGFAKLKSSRGVLGSCFGKFCMPADG